MNVVWPKVRRTKKGLGGRLGNRYANSGLFVGCRMSKLTRAEALSLSAGLLFLPSCGRNLISEASRDTTSTHRIPLGHGLYINISPTAKFPIARPDGTYPGRTKSAPRQPMTTVCPESISTSAVCTGGGGGTTPPPSVSYYDAEADGDGGGYIENYVQGILRSQDTFSSIGTDDSMAYQVVHSTLTASTRVPSANTIPVDTNYVIGATTLHYNSGSGVATVNGRGASVTLTPTDPYTIQIKGNSTTTMPAVIFIPPSSQLGQQIGKTVCKNSVQIIAAASVLTFKAEMEAAIDYTCSNGTPADCLEAMMIANQAEAQYEDMMNQWQIDMMSHCH